MACKHGVHGVTTLTSLWYEDWKACHMERCIKAGEALSIPDNNKKGLLAEC